MGRLTQARAPSHDVSGGRWRRGMRIPALPRDCSSEGVRRIAPNASCNEAAIFCSTGTLFFRTHGLRPHRMAKSVLPKSVLPSPQEGRARISAGGRTARNPSAVLTPHGKFWSPPSGRKGVFPESIM